jgi:hypothetical protein
MLNNKQKRLLRQEALRNTKDLLKEIDSQPTRSWHAGRPVPRRLKMSNLKMTFEKTALEVYRAAREEFDKGDWTNMETVLLEGTKAQGKLSGLGSGRISRSSPSSFTRAETGGLASSWAYSV